MKIDILTLFPNFFLSPINESIIKRALNKSILEVNTIDIRDFSENKHKRVDDYPYGGDPGMIIKAEPIILAYESILKKKNKKTIFLSPQGQILNNKKIIELSNYDQLILLCGRYEGIDERVLSLIIDEEISIGDYILTGGEIPALVLIDTITRYIKGAIGNELSLTNDSIINNLLKYPQYTAPRNFKGLEVPEVLLSGNHKKIKEWQKNESIKKTKKRRYDLFIKYNKGENNE